MNKNLLIIFTRNPELGKTKTRLAATIGNIKALEIYRFLLRHTVGITKNLNTDKEVHYSVKIRENDIWDSSIFSKKQQVGRDLGDRMQYAFKNGFDLGYKNIVIIGSDMYDLSQEDLEVAFEQLEKHDFVVGPAEDGGYYLLGMKQLRPNLFINKAWGTPTVLGETLKDLEKDSVCLLPKRNDIDIEDDITGIDVFQKLLSD